MKLKLSQNGFTAIHTLLLIVIIGIIGFAGVKVYDASKSANPVGTSTVTAPAAKKEEFKIPDGFVEYQNKNLGFKFSYPKTWKLIEENHLDNPVPNKGPAFFINFEQSVDEQVGFTLRPSNTESRTVDMLLSGSINEATAPKELKIGGLKAAQVTWHIKPDPASSYFPNPHIETDFDNGKYYFIVFYEYKDYYKYHNGDVPQKYIKEYNQILDTLVFTQ